MEQAIRENDEFGDPVSTESRAAVPEGEDFSRDHPSWLTRYGTIGGIATIASIAVAYALQATYLATFGVQPEQVGMNQFIALAKLALPALATLTTAAMVLSAVGWGLSALRTSRHGIIIATLICAAALAGGTSTSGGGLHSSWGGTTAFFGSMGLVTISIYAVSKRWTGRSNASLLAAVVVLGSLFLLAFGKIEKASTHLKETGRASASFLLIGANPVTVRISCSDPAELPTSMTTSRSRYADLVLLADGNGRYALFDCERSRTYIVEHGQVSLEIPLKQQSDQKQLQRCQ